MLPPDLQIIQDARLEANKHKKVVFQPDIPIVKRELFRNRKTSCESVNMDTQNLLAKQLKSLHQPGNPIVFTGVYDILSAETIASLPSSKAIATASWGVAQAWGTTDDELTLETNLEAVRAIAKVVKKYQKPLTVDLQDAYGDRLEEAIKAVISLGAVGINLEDCSKSQEMYSAEVAVDRIKRVLAVAKGEGVPDFVVNARCDALLRGGDISEVIARGKQYLEAGATTVFVWGASRGVTRAEIVQMVKEFDGRLNVLLKLDPGFLTVRELAEIGVARISMGPAMQRVTLRYLQEQAEKYLTALE